MAQATSVEPKSDDGVPSPGERANRARRFPRVRLGTLALVGVFVVVAATMGSSLVGARTLVDTGVLREREPWLSEQPQSWDHEGSWFGDQINAILPAADESFDRLRDGQLGWWSPYNNGGTPLTSAVGTTPVSPLMAPYLVLPLWLAPAWSHLLVLLVSIGGTILFLGRLGVSRAAGVVAGLAFATSGFMYLWLHWSHTRVAAFIPLLFWVVERALQERRAASVVPVALVVAVMYLSGFPAVLVYALVAAGGYGLWRLVALHRRGVARRELGFTGALAMLSVALGLGLVAWLILPFNSWLGGLDLEYRDQSTSCHAPAQALGSVVFPRYGSSADFEFVCPTGEHETDLFAGAMVLGLAAVGAIAPSPGRRGVRTYFLGLGTLTAVLVYLGGPALWLAQQVPFVGDNRIMRARVLVSFALAVLAGFGVDRLRTVARRTDLDRVVIAAAGLMGLAGLVAWRMHDWQDLPMPPLGGWVPALACVAAGGVLLAVGRVARSDVRRVALALVPLLVAGEAIAAIQPYWPAGDPDDLYAATSTTDFLRDNVGADRFVPTGFTMLPNANRVYGLRSLTGRGFYEDTWGDLISVVNGRRTGVRTYTEVWPLALEHLQAPLLDRLAVRYYVNRSDLPVHGEGRFVGAPTGRTELRPGEAVTVPLDGPVRVVGFDLAEAPEVGGERPRVVADLLDSRGKVVASGSQRLFRSVEAGPWGVAVPGDTAPTAVAARLRLVDAERPLVVNGNAGGPLWFIVEPGDDDLRLVHVEGTAIYERPTALPRIRWASEAVVEPDEDRRLELLGDPSFDTETVVLSEPGPAGSGEDAEVDVTEDSGDHISATVDADGRGYLVVADAIQRGWRAEVDGEPADLRAADHAVVAVEVPAGTHEIDLVYDPPGRRPGAWIALVSAVALAALALTAVVRRPSFGRVGGAGRRSRDRSGDGSPRSAP